MEELETELPMGVASKNKRPKSFTSDWLCRLYVKEKRERASKQKARFLLRLGLQERIREGIVAESKCLP